MQIYYNPKFLNKKELSKYVYNAIIILIIFLIGLNADAKDYSQMQTLPKALDKYIATQYIDEDFVHVEYIMRWKGYKVYRVKKLFYNECFTTPDYLLYKNNSVIKAPYESYQELDYKSIISSNRRKPICSGILLDKLEKNSNKIMQIQDNTQPPNIPSDFYKYAYTLIKEKDVRFIYIMDWGNEHIYWVYWPKYCLVSPKTIILYDGRTVRLPNKEEYEQIKEPLEKEFKNIIHKKAISNMDLYFHKINNTDK